MTKPTSGLILLDKPAGISSQTAVGIIRRLLQMKTVGHTGTLDPMATGLLPICFGRATRAAEFLTGRDKRYLAGLRLGIETETGDITGEVRARSAQQGSAADVAAVLSRFLGARQQIPPMYSAVKQNGQKLYELARQGMTVARAPRDITIHALSLVEADEKEQTFTIDVSCSKGTYIRVLCEEIGRALGTFGTMSALRRTEAGRLSLQHAYTPERLRAMAETNDFSFILSTEAAFGHLPEAKVNALGEAKIRNGVAPRASEVLKPAAGRCRVSGPGGFLALAEGMDEGLVIVKSFFEI